MAEHHYHQLICTECLFERVAPARAQLQTKNRTRILCMSCGEAAAKRVKHTTAPLSKSNYVHISSRDTLKQLNPKRIGEGV
jgi:PHP family Zn ribbon phosphoesterase